MGIYTVIQQNSKPQQRTILDGARLDQPGGRGTIQTHTTAGHTILDGALLDQPGGRGTIQTHTTAGHTILDGARLDQPGGRGTIQTHNTAGHTILEGARVDQPGGRGTYVAVSGKAKCLPRYGHIQKLHVCGRIWESEMLTQIRPHTETSRMWPYLGKRNAYPDTATYRNYTPLLLAVLFPPPQVFPEQLIYMLFVLFGQ